MTGETCCVGEEKEEEEGQRGVSRRGNRSNRINMKNLQEKRAAWGRKRIRERTVM